MRWRIFSIKLLIQSLTDGIYIQKELVDVGDCSGPRSARVVLKNPDVNFAVLECARGGVLRAGLGFDYCNVSVVTNISRDHLGMDDMEIQYGCPQSTSLNFNTTV